MNILVINPGSTSTKVAIYHDTEEVKKETLAHSREDLAKFPRMIDQLDFRYELVMGFLKDAGYEPSSLDCVTSRGGTPPNARTGATAIDDNLVEALRERPKDPHHPSSLGPIIAARIAKDAGGIPAYIYDPVSADELNPLAKVSGVKGVEIDSLCHVLNTHAMGISVAKEIGRPFDSLNLIVVHIGGGNSVCLWSKGHMIEVVQADMGAFSSERCGFIRLDLLVQLIEERGLDTIIGWLHGSGGMVSLLGTNDLREVGRMITEDKNEYAGLCMNAMAYNLAKSIASLFPVTNGEIDGIVFTGGGSGSAILTGEIKSRISYLNVPIYMRPGEEEMQALAEGAVRVMRGEEAAHIYEG